MTKKSLLSIFVFVTLLVISSCVLATNNLSDELGSSWNQTKNTFGNIGNAVGGTISNMSDNMNLNSNNSGFSGLMNDTRSTNGTAGVTTTMNTGMNGNMNTGSDYNATRTATTATTNTGGISSIAMTWIIIGITAAIIVALIWYYGTQNNYDTRVRNNNHE